MVPNLLTVCTLALFLRSTCGLKYILVGDWGDDKPDGVIAQKTVAQQMSNWCASRPCDFIFSAGDNFYPQGVTSPIDPKFETSWRQVYNLPFINALQWYISIGNNDHDSQLPGDNREWNQVIFGQTEPRWYFPNRWYDFVYTDPAGFRVHFAVIDSESLILDKNDPAAQLKWLDDTLAASTAEWKAVVSHTSPYSAGNHGTNTVIESNVVPILKRRGVQVLFCGHAHNLQHISNTTDPNDLHYVISGAGGRGTGSFDQSNYDDLVERGYTVFFQEINGFSYVEFDLNLLTVRHVDLNGEVVHTFNRIRSTAPPRSSSRLRRHIRQHPRV
jgi:hypothetical protein